MNKKIDPKIAAGIVSLVLLAAGWFIYWQVSRLIISQDPIRYMQNFGDASKESNTQPELSTNKSGIANPISNNTNTNKANQAKRTTLKKISTGDRYTSYEGSITVSGRYTEYNPETMLGGYLCFDADEKTGYLIPRELEFWGPGEPDTREPWFCFSNQAEARKLFGVDSKAIFADKTVECISGPATVTVSNYVTDRLESETFDKARLDKIISFKKYSTNNACGQ